MIVRIVADRLETRSSEQAGVPHWPFPLRRVRAPSERRDAVAGEGLKNTRAGTVLVRAESSGIGDATQDRPG
ncbi:MAG: hypothetical protein OXJ37_09770 [Bryobacterales bacterium]|nr:hypothetical protein [Bryobacterales bacterium]